MPKGHVMRSSYAATARYVAAGVVVAVVAAGCSGSHSQRASSSSAPEPVVNAAFVRAFMIGPPTSESGTSPVLSPEAGEVRAGGASAFVVFSPPSVSPECIGHAELSVEGTPQGGDPLRAYPSWPSYAADATPGAAIGPETLMDNRPTAVSQTSNPDGQAALDVTDLARAWWKDRILPSQRQTVSEGAPLVMALTTGNTTVWHIRVDAGHEPQLRVTASCPH